MKIEKGRSRMILKKARQDAGLTQKQVAETLKISETAYQNIEYGKCLGKIKHWDKMEDMFQVNQRKLREIHDKEDNR